MQGGCGRRKHAGAKRMQVRAWVWVLRARGGDLPTRCPPPLPAEDVEEEVDGKVRARALALAQQPKP